MSTGKGDLNLLTDFQRGDIQQRLTGDIKFLRGTWRCDYCGFVTVADSMTRYNTFAPAYVMYLCGHCTRHAQGVTCRQEGHDPRHCDECKDPRKSKLLTWKKSKSTDPLREPSEEWMDAQVNHLKCQRDLIERQIEAIESTKRRRKEEQSDEKREKKVN